MPDGIPDGAFRNVTSKILRAQHNARPVAPGDAFMYAPVPMVKG